jgi:hypothetical protein
LAIEELNKPDGQPCPKLGSYSKPDRRGRLKILDGCGIYAERPHSCQGYACLWYADDGSLMRNMERPDLVGVMLDVPAKSKFEEETGVRFLLARETRPQAFGERSAVELLYRLSKKCLIIMVRDRQGRKIVGPPELMRRANDWLKKNGPVFGGPTAEGETKGNKEKIDAP